MGRPPGARGREGWRRGWPAVALAGYVTLMAYCVLREYDPDTGLTVAAAVASAVAGFVARHRWTLAIPSVLAGAYALAFLVTGCGTPDEPCEYHPIFVAVPLLVTCVVPSTAALAVGAAAGRRWRRSRRRRKPAEEEAGPGPEPAPGRSLPAGPGARLRASLGAAYLLTVDLPSTAILSRATDFPLLPEGSFGLGIAIVAVWAIVTFAAGYVTHSRWMVRAPGLVSLACIVYAYSAVDPADWNKTGVALAAAFVGAATASCLHFGRRAWLRVRT